MLSPESGDSIRKRALALKDAAKAALRDGGLSLTALTKLTELWERKVDFETRSKSRG